MPNYPDKAKIEAAVNAYISERWKPGVLQAIRERVERPSLIGRRSRRECAEADRQYLMVEVDRLTAQSAAVRERVVAVLLEHQEEANDADTIQCACGLRFEAPWGMAEHQADVVLAVHAPDA
jgi:hypothetical protein